MKLLLAFLLLCAAAFTANAQSTAFTYQGRLAANGSPYTGFAEMQFALFSAPTGGVAVAASTPGIAGVNVSGGLFVTSLDFGAAAFPGADRWLEVQVRTNLGAFSTLTPRQPLTPTPYALYARTAGIAGPWGMNGSNVVYNGGKVGIGTTNPGSVIASSKLDVVGGDVVVSHDFGFLSLNASGTGIGAGIDTGQIDDLRLIAGGEQRVRIAINGRVGIGVFSELAGAIAGVHIRNETTPFAGTLALEGDTHTFLSLYHHGTAAGRKGLFGFATADTSDLTIANEAPGGRIVLAGPSSSVFATGGEENLRIVRGSIIDAAVDYGSGFAVTHLDSGKYRITFDTPFASKPTVTATQDFAQSGSGDGLAMIVFANAVTVSSADITLFRPATSERLDGGFHFIAVGPR